MPGLTYENSGVNYQPLDAFKRACQKHGAATAHFLTDQNLKETPGIRGDSAYLIEASDHYLAHVEEGLGTKNLVADAMHSLNGQSFYRNIGIDTVATIVNDLITCGAAPISIAMHAAVGESKWFEDLNRAEQLAAGFAEGCRQSHAVWGGGETPVLKGIVDPSTIVLAGSALGRILPKSNRILGNVQDGDAIILFASSGVHTNGLTLCRQLATRLPNGYLTKLVSNRTYGESLLDPSIIYADFIRACQRAALNLHYAVHLTGHGWRKLMRLPEAFVYQIDHIGPIPEIFPFIQKSGSIDTREMYATFNMGAGFAVYVPESDIQNCLRLATENSYTAWRAGAVRKSSNRKAVEIRPLNLTFDGETLAVR
jgi:phosphoribosylformylglycinamidine cyclo-ligase